MYYTGSPLIEAAIMFLYNEGATEEAIAVELLHKAAKNHLQGADKQELERILVDIMPHAGVHPMTHTAERERIAVALESWAKQIATSTGYVSDRVRALYDAARLVRTGGDGCTSEEKKKVTKNEHMLADLVNLCSQMDEYYKSKAYTTAGYEELLGRYTELHQRILDKMDDSK